MRIGWIGFHMEGIAALNAVVNAGHSVVAALTLHPDLAGRRSASTDYDSVCSALEVPLYYISHVNDDEAITKLSSFDLDLLVVLGWSQILGPEALHTARIGTVGAHASLLPKNRGSAPVNWAIIRGETQGGNTLMWLSEGVDEGAIIGQTAFEITPFDTCQTVYEKVATSNRDLVLELLDELKAGRRPGRPQPHTDQPILARRRPQDGLIHWDSPAKTVYDFIRALTQPYPGAFSSMNGQRVLFWEAALFPGLSQLDHSPGTVLGSVISPNPHACGQLVQCGDGPVLITSVSLDSGELMRGEALASLPWQKRRFEPPEETSAKRPRRRAA